MLDIEMQGEPNKHLSLINLSEAITLKSRKKQKLITLRNDLLENLNIINSNLRTSLALKNPSLSALFQDLLAKQALLSSRIQQVQKECAQSYIKAQINRDLLKERSEQTSELQQKINQLRKIRSQKQYYISNKDSPFQKFSLQRQNDQVHNAIEIQRTLSKLESQNQKDQKTVKLLSKKLNEVLQLSRTQTSSQRLLQVLNKQEQKAKLIKSKKAEPQNKMSGLMYTTDLQRLNKLSGGDKIKRISIVICKQFLNIGIFKRGKTFIKSQYIANLQKLNYLQQSLQALIQKINVANWQINSYLMAFPNPLFSRRTKSLAHSQDCTKPGHFPKIETINLLKKYSALELQFSLGLVNKSYRFKKKQSFSCIPPRGKSMAVSKQVRKPLKHQLEEISQIKMVREGVQQSLVMFQQVPQLL